MKRHSIIARLGPNDTTHVALKMADTIETEIRFIDGHRRLGFGLGQMTDQLYKLGILPSETAIDLAILAACVTAGDTRISRTADSQDSWTREIDLYVPVQNVALWTSVSGLIGTILTFLTGDRWHVFFRYRHHNYANLATTHRTLEKPECSAICLFSGGLDSFVGAVDLLETGRRTVFVSHYWDLSTSSQKQCVQRIGATYGNLQPVHVRARVGFESSDFGHEMATEPTTRGRSFLFFALATLAASGLDGIPTIYVPENGLISLNVPLDPLRVGAWSTRTTHPYYMARWQDLLRQLNIAAWFENPYRFRTKGEMLSHCRNAQMVNRCVAETISCSSIAKARWQGLPPGHCGFCVPCLIRRAAILSAFQTDPTTYTISDLEANPRNSRSPEGQHIRAFQMMIRRLARRPDIARSLIYKCGPLSDYTSEEIAQYTDVFRRGIMEVARITEHVTVEPL